MSAPSAALSTSPPGKQGGFWGKIFSGKHAGGVKTPERQPSGGAVFGVSLQDSLRYAAVAISQVGPDGKARVYGHIPVVVAKAGLYLKEQGTTTPGIFRVSGSNKRIKDLELIFDTAPTYGKDLIWESYSVHDAASAFRRYLNMLPFPIIPFELYGAFQDALPRSSAPLSSAETNDAVDRFRVLINSLPPSSQHIFFYTLDLLSVFHRNAEQNLMPASNLAMIFQPGLLRHPPSSKPAAAAPPQDADAVKAQVEADALEHRRSQEVLVFLIEHQDAFELELPRRKASSSATPSPVQSSSGQGSTAASSNATPAPVEEGWSIVSDKAGLGRKQSGSRRLRRKSARPEGGSPRLATSPESAASDSESRDRKGFWRNKPTNEVRRPDQDHPPSSGQPPTGSANMT